MGQKIKEASLRLGMRKGGLEKNISTLKMLS